MSIYETIRKDSLTARKTGDKVTASLLVTLMSEIQASGKTAEDRENPSDESSIATIKKFIKNAQVTGTEAAAAEIAILETYQPAQLTEDEIQTIIRGLKGSPEEDPIMLPTMGNIMNYFKNMYPGRYDGALVAKHAR